MITKRIITAATLCMALCACGNADSFRDTLGLNRKGPDEFQVFQRPPLTVPPDYNLPVPKNGAEYAIGAPADEQAHAIAEGKQPMPVTPMASTAVPVVSSGTLPSSADSQFLTDAGATNPNRDIRQVITNDNDNGTGPKSAKYLITPGAGADPVVDPQKEADRLKQDKSTNQPPTTGDTPVVQEDKGFLGNIFR
jgi:hypothetical protein